jgi:hypothetical protein
MIHTQTQIDNLIELAIIQRVELRKLVESLPELRTHLSVEIERNLNEIEPAMREELQAYLLTASQSEHAILGNSLKQKIAELAVSLEDTTAQKYSVLMNERAENDRLLIKAEARIAEAAIALPSAVKEIVLDELSRFPRANQIDQLRKEFAEPASLNPRGKWQIGETYKKLDLVSINGNSFIANETTSEKPTMNSTAWTLNSSKGGVGAGITSITELTGTPSNGETLIGNGQDYVKATLTAGNGISITNGAGSITVTATGGVNFQGSWNASTNTPTLTSSVGTTGFFYIVSVAGSTNLNGVTDWEVGDWAIFGTSTWTKVDNTDKVSSVFGRVGSVVGVSTDYSAVGITNTAIGASNPSTVAATTISATSTISATGAVTGSNLSGTNTGDQTNITGNAGTATALQTARAINGVNFDGTAAITVTAAGSTLSDTVTIAKGGTGQITAQAALNALLPSQSGAAGKNLQSDGTNVSFVADAGGTVTSVSVSTANGVSGTVATSTTTPAISLTLGAITPTSVAASGSVTGSNLSGTNTGDQTITLTGDITGSGTGSFATAIASGVIVNADINASAAIDDTKLATISTASKVSNSATTATNANTASAIVARDASGNFSAGTISAALTGNVTGNVSGSSGSTTGNAATATALATGRTIEITGDLAYTSPSFDGTGNVTAAGTLASVASAGTTGGSTAIPIVTINAKGLTTSITTAAVIAPAGTLSGNTLASGVTASSLTSLGTIANLAVTAGTISGTPSASTDIANKLYVDTVAQGLDAKASCVAATTADITLSGTQTIDGISVIAGNRVLVKNQTLSQNNGIYLCAAGAWTRTTDADTWDELTSAFTFIETGTVNADTGYVCTANAGGTLGTTALPWSQFSGAGSYTASTGLTLTGTAFSLTAPVTVALGGTNSTSAGIAAFNNISGFTAAGATGTTSTNLVFSTSPTLITPALGTPTAIVLTSATGLPLTTGVTGTLPVANGGTGVTTSTGTTNVVLSGSPTITTPVIAQINDASGNETLKLASIASAVNEVTIENAATGNAVHISATGGDASVGLHLAGKGASGYVNVQDSTDATKRIMFNASGGTTNTRTMLSSTQTVDRTLSLPDATDTLVGRATTDTLTNKTLTSPTITGGALNGTLGATTPSTVAATTGTFTGNIIGGTGGTGSALETITLNGGSASSGGSYIAFQRNSVGQVYVGLESAIAGNTSNALALYGGSNDVKIWAGGGGNVATITSTGLNSTAIGATTPSTGAFTTLSASSTSTLAAINASGVIILSSANGNPLRLTGTTTDANAMVVTNTGGTGVFGMENSTGNNQIAGSTGYDLIVRGPSGIAFSANSGSAMQMRLSSTGLAVTGTLSATGNILGSGTYVGMTDPTYGLVNANGIGAAFRAFGGVQIYGVDYRRWTGSATNHSVAYVGQYDKGDGTFPIGFYYDAGKTTNTQATTRIASIDTTGLAVTGTLSATGDVTFGTTRLITDASRTTIMGALELNYSGGTATVQGYDRTGAAYKTLNLSGSSVQMIVNGGGTATFTTSGMYTAVGTANGLIGLGGITSSYPAIRYNSATEVGFVIADQSAYCATRATAFNVSSDRRIKTNIRNYNESGAMIDAIVPRIYDMDTSRKMHENGKTNQIGFIAQELYPVFEQAVTKGDDNEEITEEWGIDYSKLVPVLVAELQSLRKRLAALESK